MWNVERNSCKKREITAYHDNEVLPKRGYRPHGTGEGMAKWPLRCCMCLPGKKVSVSCVRRLGSVRCNSHSIDLDDRPERVL